MRACGRLGVQLGRNENVESIKSPFSPKFFFSFWVLWIVDDEGLEGVRSNHASLFVYIKCTCTYDTTYLVNNFR